MTNRIVNVNPISSTSGAEQEIGREPYITSSRRVGAIFYDQPAAEHAIRDLVEHGFLPERIRTAVLSSAETGMATDDFDGLMTRTSVEPEEEEETKTLGGVALGAAAGVLVVVAAGIPGIGPIIAGTAAGALLSSLTDEGFSEQDARRFEQGLRAGGLLITVDAGARLTDAVQSLIRSGGYVGDGSKDSNEIPVMDANRKYRGG